MNDAELDRIIARLQSKVGVVAEEEVSAVDAAIRSLRAQVATMSASNDDLAAECARMRESRNELAEQADLLERMVKSSEAALAAAQGVIRELVECKDLNNAATRLLHEDAGSIQHGRIMNEKAKGMDAEYSRRIGPAWKAARAIIDAAREKTC